MKKKLIIASAILVAGATSSAVFLMGQNKNMTKNNITTTSPKSKEELPANIGDTDRPVTPATSKTVPLDSTATSDQSTTDTSSTKPSTPYGEDPNNPGNYIVFDKTTVMTEAGISSQDQPYADALITLKSSWTYKNSNNTNLCTITPAAKMASAGTDYLDNPVTQLKWCNSYVGDAYGSWQAALSQQKKAGYF